MSPPSSRVPASLPKAEMHVHISLALPLKLFIQRYEEGRTGSLTKRFVDPHEKNRAYKDQRYYPSLTKFHGTYEALRGLTATTDELRDVTQLYLERIAREGSIYAELSNTFRDERSFAGQVEAIAEGIEAARRNTGIEARIVATSIRNFGHEKAEQAARFLVQNPMPYVTAFGLVGDEGADNLAAYGEAMRIAFNDAGLGLTPHVAEQHVTNAVDFLKAIPAEALNIKDDDHRRLRVGHGTMIHVSSHLMDEFRRHNICLEVCLSANKRLDLPEKAKQRAMGTLVSSSDDSVSVSIDRPLRNYFREMGHHPLGVFLQQKLTCALGSDNPLLMNTNIGKEYSLAVQATRCDEAQLLQFTMNAIRHANVDAETRAVLLAKLSKYQTMHDAGVLPTDETPALDFLNGQSPVRA